MAAGPQCKGKSGGDDISSLPPLEIDDEEDDEEEEEEDVNTSVVVNAQT